MRPGPRNRLPPSQKPRWTQKREPYSDRLICSALGAIIVGTTCAQEPGQAPWPRRSQAIVVATWKIMHDAGDATFGRGTGCIKNSDGHFRYRPCALSPLAAIL